MEKPAGGPTFRQGAGESIPPSWSRSGRRPSRSCRRPTPTATRRKCLSCCRASATGRSPSGNCRPRASCRSAGPSTSGRWSDVLGMGSGRRVGRRHGRLLYCGDDGGWPRTRTGKWGSMTDHAACSPSSAAMWLACPASVTLTKDMTRPSSKYAREGTAAHAVAEMTLNGDIFLPDKVTVEGDEYVVSPGMCRALNPTSLTCRASCVGAGTATTSMS